MVKFMFLMAHKLWDKSANKAIPFEKITLITLRRSTTRETLVLIFQIENRSSTVRNARLQTPESKKKNKCQIYVLICFAEIKNKHKSWKEKYHEF